MASKYRSMHLAMHIFSESSSLGPGRVTHLAKHLSVIFCVPRTEVVCKRTRASRMGAARERVFANLHDFLDVLRGHLALDLHLGVRDVLVLRQGSQSVSEQVTTSQCVAAHDATATKRQGRRAPHLHVVTLSVTRRGLPSHV